VQDADSPSDGDHVVTTQLVGPATVDTRIVVDLRQASEQTTGHLPHAELIELGSLAKYAADLPARPATVMWGDGERAATGASLLERADRTGVAILVDAGPEEWAAATGSTLVTGR
jgi:rhodanese-related sulfurtransferase